MVFNYVYDYDALNRITNATFDGNGVANRYDLESVTYDKNGNIQNLSRQEHTDTNATTFGLMDDLTYSYQGNQLMAVSDISSVAEGFNDGNGLGDDYGYDVYGNMTMDFK